MHPLVIGLISVLLGVCETCFGQYEGRRATPSMRHIVHVVVSDIGKAKAAIARTLAQ